MCRILNCFEHFLFFISATTLFISFYSCASISAFASLVGVPSGIASSSVALKICALTTGIKMYHSSSSSKKKKRNKHDSAMLLAKLGLYINHEEFFYVKNALRKYNKMKEEIG